MYYMYVRTEKPARQDDVLDHVWRAPPSLGKFPEYRMAGNLRGSQFSRFSWLTGDPRKLNLRNKKPKRTRARAITGGVAIVVHAAAQLD